MAAYRLSSCGARALERRLSSCGARALERRLSSCGARASLLHSIPSFIFDFNNLSLLSFFLGQSS